MLDVLAYPTVVRTARLSGGGYVVAWLVHDPSEQVSPYQVCFRRLDSSGLGLPSPACIAGSEVPVLNRQVYTIPRPDGGFVLAWPAADGGVRSQAFDATGHALTDITAGAQQPVEPGAAALAGGGYVSVSMQPGGQSTSASMISFQRYSSNGTPLGAATSVGDSGGFYSAQVVPLKSGGFAVAWMQGGNTTTVMTRVFRADGTPVGAPTVASGVPPACSDGFCHWQTLFGFAPMDDGGFVLEWMDGHGMALIDGTFARRFQPDGTPGAAIGKLDDWPAVGSLAPNGVDGFLLAWPHDPAGDGRTFNVTVRRFDATPLR